MPFVIEGEGVGRGRLSEKEMSWVSSSNQEIIKHDRRTIARRNVRASSGANRRSIVSTVLYPKHLLCLPHLLRLPNIKKKKTQ